MLICPGGSPLLQAADLASPALLPSERAQLAADVCGPHAQQSYRQRAVHLAIGTAHAVKACTLDIAAIAAVLLLLLSTATVLQVGATAVVSAHGVPLPNPTQQESMFWAADMRTWQMPLASHTQPGSALCRQRAEPLKRTTLPASAPSGPAWESSRPPRAIAYR